MQNAALRMNLRDARTAEPLARLQQEHREFITMPFAQAAEKNAKCRLSLPTTAPFTAANASQSFRNRQWQTTKPTPQHDPSITPALTQANEIRFCKSRSVFYFRKKKGLDKVFLLC
jgi:hypothetical protein